MWNDLKPASVVCWTVALLVGGWLGCGCQSPKEPDEGSLAAVTVQGRAPLEIAHAISAVFQSAGYQPVPLPANKDLRLAFEKPGGTGATILYGGWSANRVWYRVRLEILASGVDNYRITCNAFRVLDHDVNTFESEHKLSWVKRSAYQQLLEQVAARLAEKGTAP